MVPLRELMLKEKLEEERERVRNIRKITVTPIIPITHSIKGTVRDKKNTELLRRHKTPLKRKYIQCIQCIGLSIIHQLKLVNGGTVNY